ncbi:MAG: GDP-mannose 4,6-dehydratase [Candidatus ainarchaeum sp.]|nr:GDP-mannose 4,6-dehydratase [Candidatus ainarchaeum sp.]
MADYLVTGACGFVGRNFVELLAKERPGSRIVGAGLGDCTLGAPGFEYRKADLSDFAAAAALISDVRPDFIFHFAGAPGASDWNDLLKANIHTTVAVLEAALKLDKKPKVFVVGSAAEYGAVGTKELPLRETKAPRPVTPYGISMAARTAIATGYAQLGCHVTVGRLFNPLGRGVSEAMAPGSFAKQVAEIANGKRQGPILVGNLDTKRDFVDIEDASRAFLAIAEKGKPGEIYNVCSGKSHRLGELLELMMKQASVRAEISVDQSRIRKNEVPDVYGSTSKIAKDIGWKPRISFAESIGQML